jgi:hypothetical protein
MPSRHPIVVALRGTPRYARALERLRREVNRLRGRELENRHDLAEYALVELAAQVGGSLPERMAPPGGPRPGSGPKKKSESGVDT